MRLPCSRLLTAVLATIAILATPAIAQTQPGLTFKIRTQLRNHQNVEKSRPDSVRLKRLAAEADARALNVDDNIAAGAPQRGRGGGANTGANNVLQMIGTAIRGWQRMDVQGVIGNPELQSTQWALFTDTSSTVVDDVRKEYWARVFDIGSILAFTSAVDNPNGRVGSLEVSWDSLPTEQYEGRPAKHYQMKLRYGLGQAPREDSLKLAAITTVTSDYWVVDLPVNFENRFAGIGRPRRQVPDSLRGEWAKMLALYEQLGRGTIVKFTASGTIGENAQRATEYTRTMELTEITEAPVDPAVFRIAPDFTRIVQRRGRGGP
jgi:hypothetical protein